MRKLIILGFALGTTFPCWADFFPRGQTSSKDCGDRLTRLTRQQKIYNQRLKATQDIQELVDRLIRDDRTPPVESEERRQLHSVMQPAMRITSWKRESGGAYEVAEKLVPLKPFRSLFRYIDWLEHTHGEAPKSRPRSLANFILGQVRNTRPSDFFAIGVTQIPYSKKFYLDMILGPLEQNEDVALRFEWAKGKESEFQWVHMGDRNYFLARHLVLDFARVSLYEELIRRVQDLYFDKL